MGVGCVPVVVMASLGSSTYTQSVKSYSEKHKTTFGKSVVFFFSPAKINVSSYTYMSCSTMHCIIIIFSCAVWRGDLLFLGSESGQLHVWNASTLTELERAEKHTGTVD